MSVHLNVYARTHMYVYACTSACGGARGQYWFSLAIFSTLVFETGLSRNQEQLEEKAQEGVKYEIQEMMMIRGSEGVHTSRHRDETVGEEAESHPTRANNLSQVTVVGMPVKSLTLAHLQQKMMQCMMSWSKS